MAAKKPFSWLSNRSAGILHHPTSLPGAHGIGVLGQSAYAFIELLREAGIHYWQTLPLGPTGFGDSPYSSLSAFAGNPLMVDLEPLAQNGILNANDADPLLSLPHDRVDFARLSQIKLPLLRLAHKRFVEQQRSYLPNYGRFNEFKQKHSKWLHPYCAFIALKDRFSGAYWGEWPRECRTLEGAQKSKYWKETEHGRECHAFFQYLFFGQWMQLKSVARANKVKIIGDIPIFVALDSADCWAHPELFEMEAPGKPAAVAGVPPDYFSETGQLWGNPLFDWSVMKKSDYQWWMERMEMNFDMFDVVRLDHFRAFYDYWRIPDGSPDATTGTWEDGPRDGFFKVLKNRFPKGRLIAEDLGYIHDKVHNLRDRLGLPGMAILHFAFDDDAMNAFLPHNLVPNSILYPGTHDNNTSRGWYDACDESVKDQVRRYFRVNGNDISWDMIRWSYQSTSNLAIIPTQDILSLGADARMNMPGTSQGNWGWRMTGDQFQQCRQSAGYLRELGEIYGRA